MPVNDPVGDMLTRIRNASRAHHDKVMVPTSKLKVEIARCLKEEGYIADVVHHDAKPQGELTLMLKYGPVRDIPRVLDGLGISILSTSRGVMGDTEARKQNLGGELICTVY
jgi:small subunit ribosomal protein S8